MSLGQRNKQHLKRFVMKRFALFLGRRVLFVIPQLFAVSIIVFFLIRLLPGDPSYMLAGPYATPHEAYCVVPGRPKYGIVPRLSRRRGAMRGLRMARARSLTEFQKAFPDEASCAAFLFERRWPGGFVCPACGKGRAAALKSRAYTYECSACGRQTSITAGTALHRTKLPLTVWFWAAHLMSTHSNGMSARQLEDQLGLTYRTAWLLTQKLRRSMVDPSCDPLEGVVEVDQAEIPFRAGDSFFDPGNAGKILIVGAVEVVDRDTNEAKPRAKVPNTSTPGPVASASP